MILGNNRKFLAFFFSAGFSVRSNIVTRIKVMKIITVSTVNKEDRLHEYI